MTCQIAGCEKLVVVKSRGLCSTHYTRWRIHGDPLKVLPRGGPRVMPPRPKKVRPVCAFDGCEKLSVKGGRGWCGTHHTRWYRHGDPSVVKEPKRHVTPALDRFMRFVAIAADGCWLWTGYLHRNGYGAFSIAPRKEPITYAHRAGWLLLRGPIPEGNHLHHLCLNRACVNPEHLEPLTPSEHKARHRKVSA